MKGDKIMGKNYTLKKPENEIVPSITSDNVQWVLEYLEKSTSIKEIPLGPISKKLILLHECLKIQGDEPVVELSTEWLREMIQEIDENVQKLLEAIYD